MRFWFPALFMFSTAVSAAEPVLVPRLYDTEQELGLSEIEQNFIMDRLAGLDLDACQDKRQIQTLPRNDFRKLEFQHGPYRINLVVQPDVMRSNLALFYFQDDNSVQTFSKCDHPVILPVLAIMSTSESGTANEQDNLVQNRRQTMVTRQQVMALHSYLTSYEPNILMVRSDSDDSSSAYMDFTVSSKSPLFPNLKWMNNNLDVVARQLEKFTPQDDGIFIQPYLAFTGRFSQYLGSRASSPVVARRFNPSMFIRTWTSSESFLDMGLAHESNGQRLNSTLSYQSEIQTLLDEGVSLESATEIARDAISRGWDYTFMEWHYDWSARLVSNLQVRHYLHDGPLQGESEEYNTWEGFGEVNRPRRQYDGVKLELLYDFSRSRCLLGENFICFQDVSLIQETGYSAMFEHNTTTLEMTGNFFGLPVFFWGRSGYNSDIIDYYRQSNSWGLGIELLSR